MDSRKKLKKSGKSKIISKPQKKKMNSHSLKMKLKKILNCNNTNKLLDIFDLPDDGNHFSSEHEDTSHSFEANKTEDVAQNQTVPTVNVEQPFKPNKMAKLKHKLKKRHSKKPTASGVDCAIQSKETILDENEMLNVMCDIISNPSRPANSKSHGERLESSATDIQASTDVNCASDKQKNKKVSKKKIKKHNKNIVEDHVPLKMNFEESIDKKKIKSNKTPKKKHSKDESQKNTKRSKTVLSSETKLVELDDVYSHNESQDGSFSFNFGISESSSDDGDIGSSYSDNSEDFDVNRSLAGKIIKKIKSKNSSKFKIKKTEKNLDEETACSNSSISCENILDKYYEHLPPKLEQNVDYVSSVLEVFSESSFNNSSAVISMATLEDDDDDLSKSDPELDHSGFTNDINMKTSNSGENMEQPDVIENINSIKLFIISNFCIAVLKANTKTYFCGKLKVSLLKGSVEVLGHKLTEKQCELYSLYVSSLLSFETGLGKKNSVNLKSKLVGLGISDSTIDDILTHVANDDSVLVLRPHSNIMTDFIRKHFKPCNVFSSGKLKDTDDQEACKLLECKFYNDMLPGVLSMNETWNEIANNFAKMEIAGHPNSALICGGKNSGKSTFLQYLVNKTLESGSESVLVIDLDPGQPEFTIAGVVSATIVKEPLLGPNFTHLRQPHRCLCLGLLNVTENQERYFACVKDLINYYSTTKYVNIPWIINTMGFSGNLGMKLLANVMNIVRPRVVVELVSQQARNNFDFVLDAGNVNVYQQNKEQIELVEGRQSPFVLLDYAYYRLEPFQALWGSGKTSVNKNLEPKLWRLLNVMAYFSQISTAKSLSVLEMIPYAIPMAAIDLAMNNIIVDNSYVASILNGRIVALCSANSPNQNKIYKLGNDPTVCHGYGIIRGIDRVEKMLYVLTPIEPSLLASVNTLVYAESLPECHLLSIHTLPPNTRIPYTTHIDEDIEHRHLMKTPKRKFNPFRLLEIKKRA